MAKRNQTAVSQEEVLKAVWGSGGIIVEVARRLGVTRATVSRYINRWSAVREAMEQEAQETGDQAELNIRQAIFAGDLETSKWYARIKLRDRGYVPGSQVSVDQEPQPLTIVTRVVHERAGSDDGGGSSDSPA